MQKALEITIKKDKQRNIHAEILRVQSTIYWDKTITIALLVLSEDISYKLISVDDNIWCIIYTVWEKITFTLSIFTISILLTFASTSKAIPSP